MMNPRRLARLIYPEYRFGSTTLEQGLALPTRVKDDEEMKRIAQETLSGLPKRAVVAQARQ